MPIVISIDPRQHLIVDGVDTGEHLTHKEELTLRTIFAHSRAASKEMIYDALHFGDGGADVKIIEVYVCRIRQKLGEHGVAIETMWGRGYCRNPAYKVEIDINSAMLAIDAKLVTDCAFAAGEPADVLVTRLLKAEMARLWSVAA